MKTAPIREFALLVVDDFENEVDRFELTYTESPKNLGFEVSFKTIESRLTTFFTDIEQKKLPTTLNLIFLPPNAYEKANAFRMFVQRNMTKNMVFEYKDTTGAPKLWEGKVSRFGLEELTEWGGLVCPIQFTPSTPRYIRKDNAIGAGLSAIGKSFPLVYPYTYAATILENNEIDNTYFDEIPLRVTIYGKVNNPTIGLADSSGTVYSRVRFTGLTVAEDEHLIIDAFRSKILLWRDGSYRSAYDYLDKSPDCDTFLYAQGAGVSTIQVNLTQDSGTLIASYRQYIL